MKLLYPVSFFFIAIATTTLICDSAFAQRSVGSLGQMPCAANGGYFAAINEDIVINRRVYTAVGQISNSDWDRNGYIDRGQPVEVTCKLAGRNSSPIHKTLTMTVGLDDKPYYWYNSFGSRVKLAVYLDGNFAGSTEVGYKEVNRFSISLENKRPVALVAECVSSARTCPSLKILEDKLIK
jgi:hypothetical protein